MSLTLSGADRAEGTLTLRGRSFPLTLQPQSEAGGMGWAGTLRLGEKEAPFSLAREGEALILSCDGRTYRLLRERASPGAAWAGRYEGPPEFLVDAGAQPSRTFALDLDFVPATKDRAAELREKLRAALAARLRERGHTLLSPSDPARERAHALQLALHVAYHPYEAEAPERAAGFSGAFALSGSHVRVLAPGTGELLHEQVELRSSASRTRPEETTGSECCELRARDAREAASLELAYVEHVAAWSGDQVVRILNATAPPARLELRAGAEGWVGELRCTNLEYVLEGREAPGQEGARELRGHLRVSSSGEQLPWRASRDGEGRLTLTIQREVEGRERFHALPFVRVE